MSAFPVEIHLVCDDDDDDESEEDIILPGQRMQIADTTIVKHDVKDIIEKSQTSRDLSWSKKIKRNASMQQAGSSNDLSVVPQKKAKPNSTDVSQATVSPDDSSIPEDSSRNENNESPNAINHQLDMTPDAYETAIAASYLSSNFTPEDSDIPDEQGADIPEQNEEIQEPLDIRGFDPESCIGTLEVTVNMMKPINKNGALRRKEVSQRKDEIYYCLSCFEFLKKKDDFLSHQCPKNVDWHQPVDHDKCSFCDVRLESFKDLMKHELQFHGESSMYRCPLCVAKFYKDWLLKSHVVKVHPSCQFCSYRASNNRNIVQHFISKHGFTNADVSSFHGKTFFDLIEQHISTGEKLNNLDLIDETYRHNIIKIQPHSIIKFPDGPTIHYLSGNMTNMQNGDEVTLSTKKSKYKNLPLINKSLIFNRKEVRLIQRESDDSD